MTKQESQSPLVSIITPFLDREKFLGEAIESVLAQTHRNWELILIDDGSTDRSTQISKKFVEKYPSKIRLYAHEGEFKNRGAGAARNLGIRRAKGEYIVFLDSDDTLFPDTIERQLRAFEANPTANVVCGTLLYWYSWEKNITSSERDFQVDLCMPLEKLYEPPSLLIRNLRSGGRKPGIMTWMVRHEFAEAIGAFEEDYNRIGEDQVFWAKLSLNGKIYVTDACLAKYRQHSDSSCTVSIRKKRYIHDWKFFYEWLDGYLTEREITDEAVWKSLNQARNTTRLQSKFVKVMDAYQRLLPLRVRYWIRDQLIKISVDKNG